MVGPENRDGSGSGRDFFDTFCCPKKFFDEKFTMGVDLVEIFVI